MDLIPTISTFILFILLALILVVAVSFLLFKLIKKKGEENESSLLENRKHIRTYIINQRKQVETSTGVKSSHLKNRTYPGLTYQNSKTSNRKTDRYQTNPNTSSGSQNQRYVIVNKSNKTSPKSFSGSGLHQTEYSPLKTLHHEDD